MMSVIMLNVATPRVENLKDASLRQAPDLLTNIRLGLNGLPGTTTPT
jgi:hypothetical protein